MTTPLHQRLGVRWLQQQPEWPHLSNGCTLRWDAVSSRWCWKWPNSFVHEYSLDITLAHDLLELAGVRALWDNDITVCVAEFASARLGVHWQAMMLTPKGDGYESRQFTGTTSLDAVLAAVEAVCVPEGWTP